MADSGQPLAEVFGHLTTDHTEKANRYRSRRLCPFNNKVPNCTKDKAKNPLGVCSIYHENQPVITCPIRFREDWIITDDAASFFFKEGTHSSSLTEVRLIDAHGKSAGNIDVVLVAYDDNGKLGEFSFGFDGKEIFCEVKSLGWEREIVEREGVNSPRLNQSKYIRGEGGSFDNSSYVQATVLKAYPKFPINQPTLLILVDDFKVPLSDDPIDMWKALFKENVGCFTTNQFCNLGAIGVLCMEKIDPDFCVYHNPMALESVIVPKEVFTKYKQVSD